SATTSVIRCMGIYRRVGVIGCRLWERVVMLLSDEQFRRAINAVSENSGVAESRRTARSTVRGAISVSPETAEIGAPPIAVQLRNLSCGGLGFTHQASMPPGRHLFVWLPQLGA